MSSADRSPISTISSTFKEYKVTNKLKTVQKFYHNDKHADSMADIVSLMFFCTCTSSKIAMSLPINLISHSISPVTLACLVQFLKRVADLFCEDSSLHPDAKCIINKDPFL